MNSSRLHLDIAGVGCGSCVAHVRAALKRLPGVHVEDVRVASADVALAGTTTNFRMSRVACPAIFDDGWLSPAVISTDA